MKSKILKNLEVATTKALVLECTVPKPGNVSRYHDFPHQKFEHFLVAGIELGAKLPEIAAKSSLGDAILSATKIMISVQSGGNTHLGSILLLVPLLASAYENNGRVDFSKVLDKIKRADWHETIKYIQAIKLTDFERLPDIKGKLNVKSEETESFVIENEISLYDWMLAGVEVNGICYEYTQGYKLTRGTAAEIMENWDEGMERAVQHGFLFALGNYVDNLVVGKKGLEYAKQLQKQAFALHAERVVFAPPRSKLQKKFQRLFKILEKDQVNPGTTADIIVGALFLIFLENMKI